EGESGRWLSLVNRVLGATASSPGKPLEDRGKTLITGLRGAGLIGVRCPCQSVVHTGAPRGGGPSGGCRKSPILTSSHWLVACSGSRPTSSPPAWDPWWARGA